VVGDRDVFLRCQVRARPPPVALYWVLDDDDDNDDNITRISHHTAGHYGQDYWTVASVCLLSSLFNIIDRISYKIYIIKNDTKVCSPVK